MKYNSKPEGNFFVLLLGKFYAVNRGSRLSRPLLRWFAISCTRTGDYPFYGFEEDRIKIGESLNFRENKEHSTTCTRTETCG